ncbi:fatty-acid amide hydrolase 2 [Condylostylus longicornis]|uniref:fatty-acid amide hydrolase 2 n=1 Tax=Condylostylus longicornis TaxID=2530218 RepID=UPI00244DB595|nr:fatty-acid amide hydrolase 2 [Condylostylus longicornis]
MSIDHQSREEKKQQRREDKAIRREEKEIKRKLHREEKEYKREEKLKYKEEKRHKIKERKIKFRRAMASLFKTILSYILQLFHILLDKLLELVLTSYWGPKKTCPPINGDKVITKSAVELARMIREKKISSHDLCKLYVDRMKDIHSYLNAAVEGPFQEALDQAKELDERISSGKISEDEFSEKPFLGVPFTCKESTAVKGKLHTLGLISRRNIRAKEDAECVRLMKEAGAIIIATSNIPEVNKWIESRNLLYGQTNNPYDQRRSVGGSSGGEAALISSCCTAFGLGTDIGGSIRIPAFCCGIFGHKATTGTIDMRGCTFRTGKEMSTMVTAGPMTRFSSDLRPLLKVLVGPTNSIKLKLDEPVDVKQLKYYYIPQNNMLQCNPISKEAQKVMFKVCEHFYELTGSKVTLAELPGIEKTANMWRYWMTQEPADFNALLGNGVTLNPFVELGKKLIGKSEFTMAAIYSLIDAILPKENETKIREVTRKCDEALTNLLGEDGILFYHSSPRTTPLHYYPLIKFNDFHYFSIFNVLKVPVTQVPLGLSSDGLPLGIQVIATRNRDSDCIAVAEELEKAFGGWVSPSLN